MAVGSLPESLMTTAVRASPFCPAFTRSPSPRPAHTLFPASCRPLDPPTLGLPDRSRPLGQLLSVNATLPAGGHFNTTCSKYPIMSLNLFSWGEQRLFCFFFFSHRREETVCLNMPKASQGRGRDTDRDTLASAERQPRVWCGTARFPPHPKEVPTY